MTPPHAAAPTLGSTAESLTSGQITEGRFTVPTAKPNKAAEETRAEFSTANTPYVQTEAGGSSFHTDEIQQTEFVNETVTCVNTTESNYLSFQQETNTSAPAQIDAPGSSAASSLTTLSPEQRDNNNATQPVNF